MEYEANLLFPVSLIVDLLGWRQQETWGSVMGV